MNITYYGDPGLTVYAILRTENGYVINPSTYAFETPGTLDHTIYSIALSESGVATGYYLTSVGVGSEATYICEYWQQLGGSPDRAADQRLGSSQFYFDGDKEWLDEALAMLSNINTTVTGSSMDENSKETLRIVRQLLTLRNRSKK